MNLERDWYFAVLCVRVNLIYFDIVTTWVEDKGKKLATGWQRATWEIRRWKITFNDDLTGTEAAQSAVACKITVVPLNDCICLRMCLCVYTLMFPKHQSGFYGSRIHIGKHSLMGDREERFPQGGSHFSQIGSGRHLRCFAEGRQEETGKSAIFRETHFNKITTLL